MKQQKNYKRIHKSAKVLGAILIGALVFSGSVFAMPIKSNTFNKGEVMTVVKDLTQNDFSYIDQWNKELSAGFQGFDEKEYFQSFATTDQKSINEGAVLQALENKDYKEWKEAVQNLEGYPTGVEVIPKEEFKILAQIKKAE